VTSVATRGADALRVRNGLADAVESCLVFSFGGVSVGLLATSTGGYLTLSQDWASLLALSGAAIVLLVRDRLEWTRLKLAFVGFIAAFAGWVALSATWSQSVTSTGNEVQRDLAYVALATAAAIVVTRRTATTLAAGAVTGATAACAYALGTRLFPDVFGGFDSTSYGYRLATPITYWNGLGIFAAVALLAAFAFAARAVHGVSRALAAAAMPLLFSTMYLTFSRGAWAALVIGALASLLVGPRRWQLLTMMLVLGPCLAVALLAISQRPALTTIGASLAAATRQGHSLVGPLLAICVLCGVVAASVAVVEARVNVPRGVAIAFRIIVALAIVAAFTGVWSRVGSPSHLAARGWRSFERPPPVTGADLSSRLFQLSNSYRLNLWRTSLHSFEGRPALGTGAGTFWEVWVRKRDVGLASSEGHSLYMETLGELGAPGLALLVAGLAVPLAAAWRGRRLPFAGPFVGAYAAWLVHAGVDWDWELVGVTLLPLLLGSALIAQAPSASWVPRGGRAVGVVACALGAAVAFIGLMGNVRMTDAVAEIRQGHYVQATHEAKAAAGWAPWSARPSELEGISYSLAGRRSQAERSFAAAVAKDQQSWILWSELSAVSTGTSRSRANNRVALLNPLALGQVKG
jgi:O-antigen ligase